MSQARPDKSKLQGPEDMAERVLRTLVALAEVLDFVPNTHVVACIMPNSSSREPNVLF